MIFNKSAPSKRRPKGLSLLYEDEDIIVTLPATLPDRHASVIKLTLDGEPRPRAGSNSLGTLVKAKDGKVALLPDAAVLSQGLMTEAKGGQPNIGGWTQRHAEVEWTLLAPKGSYAVTIEVANPAEGNALKLDFGGGRALIVTVPKTGDWAKYTTVSAGQVEINGETHLKVTAEKFAGEGAANLRSVRLEKR